MNGILDILQVFTLEPQKRRGKLVSHLVVDLLGDADPFRICKRLNP
jgi:hypothetical protein